MRKSLAALLIGGAMMFMADAIRSLYAPVAWLANGSFVPAWKPGGRPEKHR